MEASKLQNVAKDKERLQEANQKVQEMTESFARETEKKLSEKLEASQEHKNAQLQAKQERLKEHVSSSLVYSFLMLYMIFFSCTTLLCYSLFAIFRNGFNVVVVLIPIS
jgi:uncharacterized membrane protein (DUF106 family)